MEPLFIVAKINEPPGKNDTLLSFSFKIVVSVIVTTTVLLCVATHEELCDVRMCYVCKLDVWLR